MRAIACGLAFLASSAFAAPNHTQAERVVLAPGYAALTFQAPEPSTYRLEQLGKAANGKVLTSKGEATSLDALIGEKFTLLSFIYTSCSDVNGCPLASHVLNKVQRRIQLDDSLQDSVRLISLSFDRENDSPHNLKRYASSFRDPNFDWQFLTTPSDEALEEILTSYNQFVIVDLNEAGEKVGTLSHVLRVYLIDLDRNIRNIYSVSFLHPDIIVNDIRTIIEGD